MVVKYTPVTRCRTQPRPVLKPGRVCNALSDRLFYNDTMDTILAVCAGIALAAACGFRVFLPLLVASLATHFGYLSPSSSLAWIGSTPAMVTLIVATVAEIAAYYIPWVDHVLDLMASPAAVVAGTVVAAAAFGNIDPVVKWVAALIAGGGAAATIQGATVAARAVSTSTTGGLGNPVVSTLELIFAALLAVLAILLPVIAVLLVVVAVVMLVRWVRRLRSRPVAA
jgi:Domain of unknown function (DUF4126)